MAISGLRSLQRAWWPLTFRVPPCMWAGKETVPFTRHLTHSLWRGPLWPLVTQQKSRAPEPAAFAVVFVPELFWVETHICSKYTLQTLPGPAAKCGLRCKCIPGPPRPCRR